MEIAIKNIDTDVLDNNENKNLPVVSEYIEKEKIIEIIGNDKIISFDYDINNESYKKLKRYIGEEISVLNDSEIDLIVESIEKMPEYNKSSDLFLLKNKDKDNYQDDIMEAIIQINNFNGIGKKKNKILSILDQDLSFSELIWSKNSTEPEKLSNMVSEIKEKVEVISQFNSEIIGLRNSLNELLVEPIKKIENLLIFLICIPVFKKNVNQLKWMFYLEKQPEENDLDILEETRLLISSNVKEINNMCGINPTCFSLDTLSGIDRAIKNRNGSDFIGAIKKLNGFIPEDKEIELPKLAKLFLSYFKLKKHFDDSVTELGLDSNNGKSIISYLLYRKYIKSAFNVLGLDYEAYGKEDSELKIDVFSKESFFVEFINNEISENTRNRVGFIYEKYGKMYDIDNIPRSCDKYLRYHNKWIYLAEKIIKEVDSDIEDTYIIEALMNEQTYFEAINFFKGMNVNSEEDLEIFENNLLWLTEAWSLPMSDNGIKKYIEKIISEKNNNMQIEGPKI